MTAVTSYAEPQTAALVALTSSESKRLIGKAVAQLPQVKRALQKGRVVVATGSTNAFVAEELLGRKLQKELFITGSTAHITRQVPPPPGRMFPVVFIDGQVVDVDPFKLVPEAFDAGDVFIKGANAVDPQGHAGVLMAHAAGGTIGSTIGVLQARGSHLVVPVGLEKLVPSVVEAARHCGIGRFKYCTGTPTGLMPLVSATVVTEIEALALLTGARAIHVGSGGIGGLEGSVVLAIEGTHDQVKVAFDLIQSIKGEPPVQTPPVPEA